MKTIFALITLSFVASPAFAACFETKSFIRGALQNYGEVPVWTSKSDTGQTVMMVMNPETQTWPFLKAMGRSQTVALFQRSQAQLPASPARSCSPSPIAFGL